MLNGTVKSLCESRYEKKGALIIMLINSVCVFAQTVSVTLKQNKYKEPEIQTQQHTVRMRENGREWEGNRKREREREGEREHDCDRRQQPRRQIYDAESDSHSHICFVRSLTNAHILKTACTQCIWFFLSFSFSFFFYPI